MKVINLYGGPGSGKSTTAAGLFNLMKLAKYNVELVTEAAKDYVWDESFKLLENQLFVFAEQHNRLWRLRHKVEWVITDSPLLLALVYAENFYPDQFWFDDAVLGANENFDNYNFFIQRKKEYVGVGRKHSYEESLELDRKIAEMLMLNQVDTHLIEGTSEAHQTIFNLLRNESENIEWHGLKG